MGEFEERGNVTITRDKNTKYIVDIGVLNHEVKEGDKIVEKLQNETKGVYY